MAPKKTTTLIQTIPPREDAVRFIPLGGLGAIGANCHLFECNGELILVDCGMKMPDDDQPGIDYVIPDFTYIREHADQLKAIIITHAHEDHSGGLPYLLKELPKVPVYAGAFGIAILREKLTEHRVRPDFRELVPRQQIRISKNFTVEPIAVTHSMIDTMALAIRTPVGVVVHSADFKMDPNPPDGVAFDHLAFARYAEEGEDGVLLLLSDSTNVNRTGSCPSEIEVLPGLSAILREAPQTIVLSTFASSLHRLQNVMNLAAKHGREVVCCGLNMERNIRIARKVGALDIPCVYHGEPRAAKGVPRHKRLVLCTGSQGEPNSSLSRIALGEHRDIHIEEGDTVVLSARMIPGNEGAIYKMINNLARRGARVVTEHQAKIHVSGHAYRDDMRHLINLCDPKFFVPVHGEYRHLKEHCRLAIEQGLEPDEALLAEDGDIVEVTKSSIGIIGKAPHGRVLVDGKGIGDVDEFILRDRRFLSQDGMVLVIVGVDHETGELLNGPEVACRGFTMQSGDPEDTNAALRQVVIDAWDDIGTSTRTESTELQAALKRTLRRHIRKEAERYPVIVPVVMEL